MEIWEQALLPFNLPFTILMGVVTLFWLLSLIGTVDLDTFDFDFDTDPDGNVDPGGAFGGVMKFVNAQDVPVMIILSLLALFMWLISITTNFYFNPGHEELTAFLLLIGNFVASILLVKYITQPLRPILSALKNDKEHQEPLIGSSGFVKSRTLDTTFGQCEVIRPKGAPALLNCRLSDEESPLVRGDEILVIDYDPTDRKYLIKPLNPPSPKS